MTAEEGERLAQPRRPGGQAGGQGHAHPRQGCNVIARKGADAARRVVLFAHIDARMGTPGATDNASGVIVLLLLAELLADYAGDLGIELVAMNGEDYFSNPGEQQCLASNSGRFGDILLGINIDDVGYHKGGVAYSLYDCPTPIASVIRENILSAPGAGGRRPLVSERPQPLPHQRRARPGPDGGDAHRADDGDHAHAQRHPGDHRCRKASGDGAGAAGFTFVRVANFPEGWRL